MRTSAPLLVALSLAACARGDARLDRLSAGISKDSAIAVMGGSPAARTDQFLVGGRLIEAMYFARPDAGAADTGDRAMSPVVVIDGQLAAWGWTRWDSVARELKIVVAAPQ